MDPINFEKKFNDLAKQNRDRQANEGEAPSGEEKLCPFMSRLNEPVMCTPKCKLYRSKPEGYECTLQELRAISWNTKKKK
ncbi:MAG: hypothetical protein Q7K54_04450 [Candidatus Parcubacteria bacterium]|nr:hypothetical protein [Candidatus Parcubacteria bacterium]